MRRATCSCLQAKHQLIDVAPAPVLARLDRADDRMIRRTMVRRRVAPGGVVAAAYVPARLAHAQVHPAPAGDEAFLAARDVVRRIEELDGFEVRAVHTAGA